jgi:adenine phosphoribosyltransferase
MSAPAALDLRAFIRDVPDFPKPGIVFKDITPLLGHAGALRECVRRLAALTPTPEAVVAIESRGFVFGTALALHWGVPLVPARKFGKLPGRTIRETYTLEYGEDGLELQADAPLAGRRAVVVDDLLATGGTALATVRLAERLGAKVEGLLVVIELKGLGGRERLAPHQVHALIDYTVNE